MSRIGVERVVTRAAVKRGILLRGKKVSRPHDRIDSVIGQEAKAHRVISLYCTI
jgi:hypothetical protein